MTARSAPLREWEVLAPLGSDMSPRRWYRIRHGKGTAAAMQGPADGSPEAFPGHGISDYVALSGWLRERGFRAPEIYEADPVQGTLLVEDFGDVTFRRALETGAELPEVLYDLAAEVLGALAGHEPPEGLSDYYDSHIHARRRLIVDWFIPVQGRVMNRDGLVESYLEVWEEIESRQPTAPQGFVHGDYHFDNLMWLPHETGLRRCGLLDFQGALRGPRPAYDLVNFLEDVRGDAPQGVQNRVMTRFCAGFDPEQARQFRIRYRILAAQFHCRVAGQFIRAALRLGRFEYLVHLPRVLRLLRAGLEDPVLEPLKNWFAQNGVDLTRPPDVNPEEVRRFIREDAP